MKRILVVNDEESLQVLYTQELLEEGYEVLATGAGARALEMVNETLPDLVLLDLTSPQTDIPDLLQDIKETRGNLSVVAFVDRLPIPDRLKLVPTDHCVLKSSCLTDLKLKIKVILDGRNPVRGWRMEARTNPTFKGGRGTSSALSIPSASIM